MRRTFNKVLCLVLAVLMCVSLSAVAEVNRTTIRTTVPKTGEKVSYVLGVSNEKHIPSPMADKTGYLAQYFVVPEGEVLDSFKACVHGTAKEKDMTFRIYRWDTSLEKTLASKPLEEKNLGKYTDCGHYTITMTDDYTGEFLFWAGNSIGRGGVWTSPYQNVLGTKLFKDGNPVTDLNLESSVVTRKVEELPEITEYLDAYEKHSAVDYASSTMSLFEREIGTGEKIPMLDAKKNTVVCYRGVDFGETSPKTLKLTTYNMGCDDHTVELQLVIDDVKKGDILGSAMSYYCEPDPFVEEVNIRLTKEVTGVHDIYITSNFSGLSLIDWQFAKETLPYTGLDKLIDEFKPVPDSEIIDHYEDTWVTSDMLGRKLPSIDVAGPVKDEEKYIAMFYWVWRASDSMLRTNDKILNVQQALDLHEGDDQDIIYDPSWKGWKGAGGVWFNESIYGYAYGMDDWKRRKELELLSAADVDMVVLDCPSGMYSGGYIHLAKIMHEMRKDGLNPPKMVLRIAWNDLLEADANLLERHYHEYVEPGLFSDSYFMYEGKPLIASWPKMMDNFKTGEPERDAYRQHIKDVFTFRPMVPSYFTGPTDKTVNQWPWLEVYPQHEFGKTETGGVECVCVGIAQNTAPGYTSYTAFNVPDCFGRSYTYKRKFQDLSEDSDLYGFNFQEQWDRALEVDPRFVFVTGWNELTTGRFSVYDQGAVTVNNGFGDSFCDEYSRDIIPIKGDYKDNYYLQLISNIRKFKGVRPTPVANEAKTVAMGDFAAWESVEPTFYGYKGGTEPRDEYAIGARKRYRNYTGRNDILYSKVTRDNENVYFYVETAENLTPYTDHAWMRLFLNTDRVQATGWEGYDYVINRISPTENKVYVEKNRGSDNVWQWEISGEGEYTVSGNKMMIKVPRSALGLEGKALDFEFKWNDNMQQDGYLMDFYVNGDTAPVGRFNYHYIENASQDKTPADEFIVVYDQLHDMVKYDIAMFIDNPKGFISGDVELIDATNDKVMPVIINDKTMVPIRYIVEAVDAVVEWDDATSTAIISKDGKKISIKEGESQMKINKRPTPLQSPAVTMNDRLYVPLRDIVEGLGLEVFWHDDGLIIIGETAYRTANETTVKYLLDFYERIDKKN